MKSYRKELWFNVPSRRAFINITPQVETCLRESGIREGLLLCNAMHITASVFINDDESGLLRDYDAWLEKLAPHEPVAQYRHNGAEDNAENDEKQRNEDKDDRRNAQACNVRTGVASAASSKRTSHAECGIIMYRRGAIYRA